MATTTEPDLDRLLADGEWGAALRVIETELASDPDNHWLRTQLGVTHYEQRDYREALTQLLMSLDIVPDCPLTLWHVAGTLDALGKPAEAVPVYRWLIGNRTSPDDDPCWESPEWADALKTDCVYRLGICLRRLGRAEPAGHCFRRYIDLLLSGATGMYPIEDAVREVRALNGHARPTATRATFAHVLRDTADGRAAGRRTLPRFDLGQLLAG